LQWIHGSSIVVSKRVQVGVGRGVFNIASSMAQEETERYELEPDCRK
jgi:hypothetical protein